MGKMPNMRNGTHFRQYVNEMTLIALNLRKNNRGQHAQLQPT